MESNYYAILPATVRYDKNLSHFEKLLFAEITSLTNKYGYCFCRNSYFAELYGMTKQHISSAISNLQKNEYIVTKIIYGEAKNEIKERRIYLSHNSKNLLEDPIKKNLNSPIKKNLKDNSKDINNIFINKNIVPFSEEKGETPSEESSMKNKILQMSKSKPTPPKEYPINDLITYWNSLPQVPQHRNNTTKIYQEINSIIWKIKRGTFFSSEHTPITDDFLNRHDIDFKKIGKLNRDQIKKAFLHISLMYGSSAYEPKDKKYIHKLQSLKTLIYNPTSQNSWFLALLNNPPKKVKAQKASIMDKYPVEFGKYAEFCNATTEASKNSLRSELDKIVMFYRALPEVVHKKGSDFASFCSTEVKFLRHYLDDYLKNQDWLKDVNVSTIAVSGRVFPKYLKHHWDERSNYSGNCLTQYL